MVRGLKSPAATLDKRHPPEQFVWGDRQIVLKDAVTAGNKTRRVRKRGFLDDAVCNKPAIAHKEHDLPDRDFLKDDVLNREEVTGQDRGCHACAGDAQSRATKCAHRF